MLAIALPSIVSLLAEMVPALTTSTAVKAAVDAVVALAPVVVKTTPALIQQFKDIIATLRGNSLLTTAQLDALDKAEAGIDKDYDEAIAAARAADAPTDPKPAA